MSQESSKPTTNSQMSKHTTTHTYLNCCRKKHDHTEIAIFDTNIDCIRLKIIVRIKIEIEWCRRFSRHCTRRYECSCCHIRCLHLLLTWKCIAANVCNIYKTKVNTNIFAFSITKIIYLQALADSLLHHGQFVLSQMFPICFPLELP